MATKINKKNKEKERKEKEELKKRIKSRREAGSKKIHDDDIDTAELMRRIESRKKPEVTTYSKE